MPVALVIQDLLDYLDGTGAVSPRTFYGLTVSDATLTARVIDPANSYYNQLLAAATITAKPALAKQAALAHAAQRLLGHLRTLLLAGGKVDSYSIGNMSVTKQNLLALLHAAVEDARADEARLLPLLISSGQRQDQSDLLIQDPLLGSDGVDRIQMDAPGYGGFY